MRARRLLLVPVLALALSVAGCGDGDPVADPTTPSVSPTSSTPSPTAVTSESEKARPESAEDFIRRFVDVKNEMVSTGDQTDFASLVQQGCTYCNHLTKTVRGIYENGGNVLTRGWEIRNVRRQGGTKDSPDYRVELKSHPTRYKKSADGRTFRLTGEETAYHFYLRRSADTWVIDEVVEMSS